MTPQQKIKHLILIRHAEFGGHPEGTEHARDLTAEAVDEQYATLVEDGEHWDAMNEVREGQAETDIKCDWSRHYESKSVAAQYLDGSWVGWTYWYGGGKHAEPEAIDWIPDAYDLNCTEEEKTVTVRTFARVEPEPAQ
jgi:hypothetical protein